MFSPGMVRFLCDGAQMFTGIVPPVKGLHYISPETSDLPLYLSISADERFPVDFEQSSSKFNSENLKLPTIVALNNVQGCHVKNNTVQDAMIHSV